MSLETAIKKLVLLQQQMHEDCGTLKTRTAAAMQVAHELLSYSAHSQPPLPSCTHASISKSAIAGHCSALDHYRGQLACRHASEPAEAQAHNPAKLCPPSKGLELASTTAIASISMQRDPPVSDQYNSILPAHILCRSACNTPCCRETCASLLPQRSCSANPWQVPSQRGSRHNPMRQWH